MKKVSVYILAAMMMVAVFCGCENKVDKNGDVTPNTIVSPTVKPDGNVSPTVKPNDKDNGKDGSVENKDGPESEKDKAK